MYRTLVQRKYPARRDSRDAPIVRAVNLEVFVDDELEDRAGRLVLLVLVGERGQMGHGGEAGLGPSEAALPRSLTSWSWCGVTSQSERREEKKTLAWPALA